MIRKDAAHIPDEELLQMLDGELRSQRAAAVNDHLAACWQCRARRSQLESTIAEFMEVHQGESTLPPIDAARHRLETRLAELASLPSLERPGLWGRSLQAVWAIRRHAYAGLIGLVILAAAAATHFLMPGVQASSIPNTRLTPGSVRPVTLESLCSSPDVDTPHPVSDRVAFRVFDKYGIHDPQPRTYEVDYLISPALGGSEDIRNLWPEPYASGVWNAHVKDALEDRLHELVCSGKLDLATAQQAIAANWINAYKKYFHSDFPLELHASFSKDPPWE